MKHTALIALFLALGIAGCNKKEPATSPPPTSGSDATASQPAPSGSMSSPQEPGSPMAPSTGGTSTPSPPAGGGSNPGSAPPK